MSIKPRQSPVKDPAREKEVIWKQKVSLGEIFWIKLKIISYYWIVGLIFKSFGCFYFKVIKNGKS